ncbi:homoserine kinase [Manganibacter manganicus]|uniref:Homoserine kinase n=1 Tax=Manganibacter manganicus TaxID=1873176 RepID=A0A1V8RNH5_9HYPH|nr:homoserine kinase [Pseudaminobacter manganicus]OQM74738.1 homoserine kinase [Pseudaminobacter manganicus]
MAVYTDIAEGELARFLKDYEVGELLSYKGIAEGVENSNFLIHASNGAYILTLYEKRVNPADLPFFLGLMQHLNDKGISCPLPLSRKDGATTGELAGRPAAIVTFLEGMWMRRPTVEHCRAVGAALAGMHLAGQDFSLERPNALSVSGWRPLWEKARARADEVEPGLAAEVERDLALFEANWPRDLPAGVIHADLFPDNVFFLGERLSGLIDFYFACTDLLAYDVAVCLNAWCFEKDNSYNLTKGMALLEGYVGVRALSRAEADALPILAHGAALRFMLTRLYDWLNTPAGSLVVKKDPVEYLRRMRFHRQVRSAAEYGLKSERAAV